MYHPSHIALVVMSGLCAGIVAHVWGLPFFVVVLLASAVFLVGYFFKLLLSSRVLLFVICVFCVLLGFFWVGLYEHFFIQDVSHFGDMTLWGVVSSIPRPVGRAIGFSLDSEVGPVWILVDAGTVVSFGDRIQLQGTVKPLTGTNRYLKRERVSALVAFPEMVNRSPDPSFSLLGTLSRIRDSFSGVLSRVLPSWHSSLGVGMVLGQGSVRFPNDLKDAMRASGTTHLVALSGYNIAVLVSFLFTTFAFLGRRWRVLCALVCVFLFVLMTGAESSVVRAALMGSLVLVAMLLSRLYDFRYAALFAAFIMSAQNPFILRYDIGFILSFLALFGVVYLAPVLFSLVRVSGSFLLRAMVLASETIGAQLMVLPVLAFYFDSVSFLGILSNLFILPLVPVTMFLCFVVGFMGMFLFPLAQLCAFALLPLLSFEVFVIRFFGSFTTVSFHGGLFFTVLYYIAIVYILTRLWKKKNFNEYVPF